jgi:4-amino-4-deoxy-L-arabinose transferase-like glycosyltransferase
MGGIAAIALYHLGSELAGPWAGIGAAAIFALNPDIVHWHCYILTDSLYISAVILATWATHRAIQGNEGRHWSRYLLAAVILSVPPLMRPNGWLLVLIAACYWYAKLTPRLSIRVIGIVLGGIAFVTGFFVLLSVKPGLLTNSPETMLRRGEVIWGYPAARVSMPQDEALENGLLGASGYVLRHPLACLRLAVIRVVTELVHARPYYSSRHNAVCLLAVLPVYLFGIYGLFVFQREDLTRFLALLIAAHLTIQGINYADWSGRFLLYVFPLIGVLASVGLVHVLARGQLLYVTHWQRRVR